MSHAFQVGAHVRLHFPEGTNTGTVTAFCRDALVIVLDDESDDEDGYTFEPGKDGNFYEINNSTIPVRIELAAPTASAEELQAISEHKLRDALLRHSRQDETTSAEIAELLRRGWLDATRGSIRVTATGQDVLEGAKRSERNVRASAHRSVDRLLGGAPRRRRRSR